jgi:exonuclease VII small subunit
MNVATKRHGRLRRAIFRVTPFASFAGLSALTAVDGTYPLAVLFGIGALVTGKRLFDRRGNRRRELERRARTNAAELGRVAREDRIAAPQMKRLAALQEGVLESFELLPEEHRPLLFEDLRTVVDEVEASVLLARRRSALRRHLEAVKRRAIIRRIRGLEKELKEIEEGSALSASFEAALESRRGELAVYDEIPRAIGLINAQLEGIESLLGNLRGELLAVDPSTTPLALESGLMNLKHSVAYFRRSLEEVNRSTERLAAESPDVSASERTVRRLPGR